MTWPNHTTLATGVHAGRHGVIGNNYYDRAQNKVIPLIPDPLFDKAEIVKAPTVYDVVHAAGLKTAGVCWPASRNAATLDLQLPGVFDQAIFEGASTPSLLAELKEKGIPYWKQNEWCKIGNAGKPQRDWMYTRIAQHLVESHRPNFLALHLVSVDALEHATGRQSEEAYWAIADSDRCLRDLVESVERTGLAERFRKVEGVEVVIEPKDFAKFGHQLPAENPQEPDLMLGAADGYSFSGKDDGDEAILPTDGPKGSHGDSTFHDPMGAALVASGAGIKEGVVLDRIDNTDVAPTMAARPGVRMENTEVRVLPGILSPGLTRPSTRPVRERRRC